MATHKPKRKRDSPQFNSVCTPKRKGQHGVSTDSRQPEEVLRSATSAETPEGRAVKSGKPTNKKE